MKDTIVEDVLKSIYSFDEKNEILTIFLKRKNGFSLDSTVGEANMVGTEKAMSFLEKHGQPGDQLWVAHNHPSKLIRFSKSDVLFTENLRAACERKQIVFVNHSLFVGNEIVKTIT